MTARKFACLKDYKIVSADGTAVYYKMKTNSSYYKNSIVKATFENGYAKLMPTE